MTISNGDTRGVYTGEWSMQDDTVALTYQFVERTIVLQSQKLPGPVQHTNIKLCSRTTLGFAGKQFHREVALDVASRPAN